MGIIISTKVQDNSFPTLTWDKNTNRRRYVDANAAYVFNFYGKYSTEEFSKANMEDPNFEKQVHDWVNQRVLSLKADPEYFRYYAGCIHYKGQKYGLGFFNMAYMDPIASITLCYVDVQGRHLPEIRVSRFSADEKLRIFFTWSSKTIKWNPMSVEFTAQYICDLADGHNITLVENDMGVQPTVVKDKEGLYDVVRKLVAYMLSIHIKS